MRPFEFLAKPYSVTYAKVRALVRNCQETSKSHQNSDDFGINIDLIFAVLGKLGFDFLVHLFNVIARHCQIGDPAGYSVLAGKRRTQAKE